MKIYIKTPPEDSIVDPMGPAPQYYKHTDTIYSINIPETTTITTIKSIIKDKCNVSEDAQRLIYWGKQLEDGKTLADYNIPEIAPGVAAFEYYVHDNNPMFYLAFRMRG